MSISKALEPLKHTQALFEALSAGRHLDASQDPELWSALGGEHYDAYAKLFAHLGQTLVKNARGYAYFEVEDSDAKGTRPLALLYLLVFQTQHDAGNELHRFDTWILDERFFTDLRRKNLEILRTERMDGDDAWKTLINKACKLGFFAFEGSSIRLLPATWRFLDLFLEMAQEVRERGEELASTDEPDAINAPLSDEEDES
jgi:hypothetical protein